MIGRWRLPKLFMQTASVVNWPAGTDTGQTITIDIQPAGMVSGITTGSAPFDPRNPFSHVGYVDYGDLGPISRDAPSRHRLVQDGRQFEILRIHDWDGYYKLDLEEQVGG